jgi:transcriptional regulator with XRE-family HTH domain
MQNGRERLAAYRHRSRMRQNELADLLGLTDSYLSQILSGRRRPGLDIAVRIETLTGVPVESWADTSVSEAEPKQSKRVRKTHSNSELTGTRLG